MINSHMPLDDTQYYDEIRRRAGIRPGAVPTTKAYDELNPPGIQITVSEAELTALIAVLEYVQTAKDLVPTRQLLDKLKKTVGRAPPPRRHDPLDQNNPYYGTAVLGADRGR